MIVVMSKLTFASTLVILCLAGCSERTTSSPAEDPSDVEVEYDDSETDASEADSEQSGDVEQDEGSDDVEQEEVTDDAEEGNASDAPKEEEEPPKKDCATLTEGTCKVTVGCAWSTDKKCVDQ